MRVVRLFVARALIAAGERMMAPHRNKVIIRSGPTLGHYMRAGGTGTR